MPKVDLTRVERIKLGGREVSRLRIGSALWVKPSLDPVNFLNSGEAGTFLDFWKSQMFSDLGVTPSEPGGRVQQIQNRIGVTHGVQEDPARRPLWQPDGLYFNGTTEFLNTGILPPNVTGSGNNFSGPGTLAICAKRDGNVNGSVLGCYSTGTRFSRIEYASGSPRIATSGVTLTGETSAGTDVLVHTYEVSPAISRKFYVNGQLAAEEGVARVMGLTPYYAMAHNNGTAGNAPSALLRGWLRGVLIIDRALTSDEVSRLSEYWLR